jgi:hypothetical protein
MATPAGFPGDDFDHALVRGLLGVQNMTYDTAAVEAALFRSTGIKYGGMQYGPAPRMVSDCMARRGYLLRATGMAMRRAAMPC